MLHWKTWTMVLCVSGAAGVASLGGCWLSWISPYGFYW
jgi:hypothetical protein